MYKLIELFNQLNFRWPLFAFIKNGLFHFITLSAFIENVLFLPYCIIKRGLYQPLLK